MTSLNYIPMQVQGLQSSHKRHRPSIETIAKRIQQQNRCRLPQHEQVYLELIRINMNEQKIPVKVDVMPWQLRNTMVSQTVMWHRQLKLNKSVLFDSIVCLDRYISFCPLQEIQLQSGLIIISILYLCYKREQKRRKSLNNWMETIKFYEYSAEKIIQKQFEVLEALDYNLEFTNSFDFMSFLTIDMDINENTFMLARYFLELAFFLNYQGFYQFINYQGLIGATALYLSCHFLQPSQWNNHHMSQLNVTQDMLEDCASMLFQIIIQITSQSPFSELLKPVRNKFMKKCYLEVAAIKFQSMQSKPALQKESVFQQKDQQKDLQCSNSSTTVSHSLSHRSLKDSSNRFNLIGLKQIPQKISCIKISEINYQQTPNQRQEIQKLSRKIVY